MEFVDGSLVVGAQYAGVVRHMLTDAAASFYTTSPDGEQPVRVRQLARGGDELTFSGDEVRLLRGVAGLTLLREGTLNALQRAEQPSGTLAVGIAALATNCDPEAVDQTIKQFGLDEQTQRLANIGHVAFQILDATAPEPATALQ